MTGYHLREDRRKRARRAEERKRSRRDYKLSYQRHQFVLQTIRRHCPIAIGKIRQRWNETHGESVSYKTIARDIQDLIAYDLAPLEYRPDLRGWVHQGK